MDIENVSRITQTAATIASVMGILPPCDADAPISAVVNAAKTRFDGRFADRVLMYNPDAIATWLYRKYADMLQDVCAYTELSVPLRTVMPSVTPVCFASMYSGLTPQLHGIQSYTKPVLQVDTLFDAVLRSGKRAAIVSTAGDSMSKIFLERNMDYFIFDSCDECLEEGLRLVETDAYDLLVVYNRSYDATMHKYGPESPQALAALQANAHSFAQFAKTVASAWQAHDTLFAFAPDHGCHEIDGQLGSHGLDMDEDMYITHFYGFNRRRI